MLAKLGTFFLADGTISGGVDLTNFRLRVDRVFEVITPLQSANPVLLDRELRKFDLTFTVARVHASIDASEVYIQEHDATIPTSGAFVITTIAGLVWTLSNAALTSHNLTRETGSTTFHAYHIVGGAPFEPAPVAGFMLIETGDHMLLETGDKMLLEG
jgi:hypothetical protein